MVLYTAAFAALTCYGFSISSTFSQMIFHTDGTTRAISTGHNRFLLILLNFCHNVSRNRLAMERSGIASPVQRLVSRYHRLIARMIFARASSFSASAHRFVARYNSARFSRLTATSGWSGPNAFSLMARERLKSGSALA